MAELALSIVGVALAWKGIVDFGELITKLLDDDASQREGLTVRLEVSQHMLKDWGAYWGIDRPDGRFHTFEIPRKELIIKIIFRLSASRKKALKKLKENYDISDDWGTEDASAGAAPTDPSNNRVNKVLQKLKTKTKRSKEKTLWTFLDKTLVTDLVTETFELHECLNSLTFMSTPFLLANISTLLSAQHLESNLARLEVNAPRRQNSWELSQRTTGSEPENGVDEKTLAGLTAKSITTSEQADTLRQLIDEAYQKHGDSRFVEKIALWWNDSSSRLLVLEGADEADDKTSTYACVLLYHIVVCPKLIYIFKTNGVESGELQFEQILRTFIRRLIALRNDGPDDVIQFSPGLLEEDVGHADRKKFQELVDVVVELLKDAISSSNDVLMLIVDGWENISPSNPVLISAVQSFVSRLHGLCQAQREGKRALFKVLFACKGHATVLYDVVGVEDVVDLTDRANQEFALSQEMAVALR